MTVKADAEYLHHKIGYIDTGFGEAIIRRKRFCMIRPLWCGVFKKRFYPYSPLSLFYLQFLYNRQPKAVEMILTLNAYLNFFMEGENLSLKSATHASHFKIKTDFITNMKDNLFHYTIFDRKISAITSLKKAEYKRLSWQNNIEKSLSTNKTKIVSGDIREKEVSISKMSGEDNKFDKADIISRDILQKAALTQQNITCRRLFHPGVSNAFAHNLIFNSFLQKWEFKNMSITSDFNIINNSGVILGNERTGRAHLLIKPLEFAGNAKYKAIFTSYATDAVHLNYLKPAGNVSKEAENITKAAENINITSNKKLHSGDDQSVSKQSINISNVADEVYRLIENKLRIEKERRGIFR